MKKAIPVMLYPGVVLRSNGMLVMPRVPRPQSQGPRLSQLIAAVPARRPSASAKRK